MQGRGVIKPPIGIAYDCDFGNNIDTVLTLAFLRSIAGKGDARTIAVSISKANLKAAQAEDGMTTFYSPAPVGGGRFGGGVGVNPPIVGLATNGKMANDTPIIDALVSRKNADGKPAFPTLIGHMLDTADGAISTRNILLAQNDLNAIVLVDGPLTGTAGLLDLYGAKPQITAKVKFAVVTDSGIKADIAAARKVFAEWPTPIYVVGAEVGAALPFPGSSFEKDYTWSTGPHPMIDAYKAFKPMPYDAPSPGLAAALYAVHPDDGYFKVSEPGTVTVTDDGTLKFTAGAGGKHHTLSADMAQKDKVLKLYAEVISAKPVAPAAAFGRGGRGASGGRGGSGAGGRGVIVPAVPAAQQ